MKPKDIIDSARSMIGTPFHHQGRMPNVALDCAGVIVKTFSAVGVECYDEQNYASPPEDGTLARIIDRQSAFVKIPAHEVKEGDVILLMMFGAPNHLAIHAGENMIHSYEAIGKVCEQRLSDRWRSRIIHGYRCKGMTNV
jgi:cell wall-associated NlpC family hydrolase